MTFAESIVNEIMKRRHNVPAEPYVDAWRFPGGDPYQAMNSEHIIETVEGVIALADGFNRLGERLADDGSRALVRSLLAFHALGSKRVTVYDPLRYAKAYQAAQERFVGRAAHAMPPFQPGRYNIDFAGENLTIEAWEGNIASTFFLKQYHFERGRVRIRPEVGDVIVDGGACFGDTALAFAACAGPEGHVYSFDPIPRHQEIIAANLAANPTVAPRITVVPHALWDVSDQELNFGDAGAASRPGEGLRVTTKTIDTLSQEHNLSRLDFIKMDIEGSEIPALKGATEAIKRFKPKLAISAYHKFDDLITISDLISDIDPSYAFFVDHYSNHIEETLIYAIPS